MYYYILFGEVDPPGNWEEVEEVVPIFDSTSEEVLTPSLSRFYLDDNILPLLTYLPSKSYIFATPVVGVKGYLEEGKWLFLQSATLETEPALLRWLDSWLVA